MSNYPPGVTGREFQIAGPDSEKEEEETCPKCGFRGTFLVLSYGWDRWSDCPECGEEVELEQFPYEEDDPDSFNDAQGDR